MHAQLDLSTWEVPEPKQYTIFEDEIVDRINKFYSRKGVRLPSIPKEVVIDVARECIEKNKSIRQIAKERRLNKNILRRIYKQCGIIIGPQIIHSKS